MPKRFVPPLLAVVSLLTPLRAAGDAIVVTRAATASTIAEIFVEESAVRVEVEIGPSDLPAFRNLLPDGIYQRLGHEPEPLASRWARLTSSSGRWSRTRAWRAGYCRSSRRLEESIP